MIRADLAKQPEQVSQMFDTVADGYDRTNDAMTFGLARRWRRAAVAAVDAHRGQRVLDIGAGTGTSAEPFADAGVEVVAADFSPGMLRVGKRRRPDMDFVRADAMRLPFRDDTFDAVTMSFALRNVVEVDVSLREFLRVTRPGGRIVVLEVSHPALPVLRQGHALYVDHLMPRLAALTGTNRESYRYLAESTRAWPEPGELAARFTAAGWTDVQWRPLSAGIVAIHRATKPA